MLKQTTIRPQRFANLVAVEFRKLFATVPNRILIVAALMTPALIAVAVTLEYETLFQGEAAGWLVMAYFVQTATQYLLPPLIILLVTTEWGTRSAMTTFTLTPRRGRVVAAKAVVTLVASTVAWLVSAATAIAADALAFNLHGHDLSLLRHPADEVAKGYFGFLLLMFAAFAVALLIHNTAAAISVVLVVPIIIQIAIQFGGLLGRTAEWLSLSTQVQQVLLAGDTASWPKLVVATIVWVVVPLVVGTSWTMRREAA